MHDPGCRHGRAGKRNHNDAVREHSYITCSFVLLLLCLVLLDTPLVVAVTYGQRMTSMLAAS
jgi:hypothetical protein